jgi:riboflavin kinase/FMN adenylyltransferase
VLFFDSLGQVPADFAPSAVTIGKFDGVHSGHRGVIAELRSLAAERGLVSTVLTFDRHPLSLLKPELTPARLVSNAQKRELLADTGLDVTVMIPFDESVSLQSPEDFIEHTLVDTLNAKLVLVGPDFRFGHLGRGNLDLLVELGKRHGFEARAIGAVQPDGDRSVSSTWIRELLSSGRVREATALLGHEPAVRSIVVHGEQRGRALGYPTANLAPELEGYIPADGVYAAWLRIVEPGHEHPRLPAAVSIGNNPTFVGVPDKRVEAHVLDATLDLYDKTVEVSFVEYIRGMLKFSEVAELVTQMNDDEVRVRGVLGIRPND